MLGYKATIPVEEDESNYYRAYRERVKSILSGMDEIVKNVKVIQDDPNNSSSAFYFM